MLVQINLFKNIELMLYNTLQSHALHNPDETIPLATLLFAAKCVRQSTYSHAYLGKVGMGGGAEGGREGGGNRSQRVVTKLGVPVRNSK